MSPSEQFLRHAAECELMSEFSHNSENRAVWKRMAERWIRCAELYDTQATAALTAKAAKRYKGGSSHVTH
jgi:hypothetical protein